MKGFNMKTGNMTMGELMTMSKELQGLRNIRLAEDGNYCVAVPKQIIRDNQSKYMGLPELIMAEEFTNIPPTLEKDYVNYKMDEINPEFKGVFEYDLNKHLVDNLLDFRSKVADDDWFNSQSDKVKDALLNSKYYIEEDGKRVLKQKALLIQKNMTEGEIINHIQSYTTELIFYADPQVQYRLEPDTRWQSTGLYYRVDGQKEADALGVEKGDLINTPWLPFIKQYNSAFNKIYMQPIRDKYPNIKNSDFKDLPEVEEANKQKLVINPVYKVITLMCRINTDERDEIQVESGGRIPTYLSRMQLKSHQFEKYFKHEKVSDVHFEPSFALMKMSVPKREGDNGLDYKKQYDGIKTTKPEVTLRNGGNTDTRVPNLHPNDKEWSRRMKEEMLNFPFKQAYVTSNTSGFGQQLKPSAVKEIIRNISLPIYAQLEEDDYLKENFKNLLVNDVALTEEEIQRGLQELNSTGGQFSGNVQPQQPVQQPVQQPAQQPVQQPVPPQQPQSNPAPTAPPVPPTPTPNTNQQ